MNTLIVTPDVKITVDGVAVSLVTEFDTEAGYVVYADESDGYKLKRITGKVRAHSKAENT